MQLNFTGRTKTPGEMIKSQFFSSRSNIIKIPSTRYHDIDTTEDWNRAELFYKVLKKENKI